METFERELKRGTLEMLLLRMLRDGPSYGYAMVARLRRHGDDGPGSGGFDLKEGTLYPVLYRLEEAGWIEPEWRAPEPGSAQRGVPRKYYRLTARGEEHAGALEAAWRRFVGTVEEILAPPAETPPTDEPDPADTDPDPMNDSPEESS